MVHKGLYVERDHPWGPAGGVQKGVLPPSLNQLQGESFDHQDQTGDTDREKVHITAGPQSQPHTKGHIWAGLAHSSCYTNVGDKSAVIECASVQLFSP